MKLTPNQIIARLPALLSAKPPVRVFLLFGNDESRANACQQDILTHLPKHLKAPMESMQFAASALIEGEPHLKDELGSSSLLGDVTLYRIGDVDDKFLPLLQAQDFTRTEHFVLLQAESLTAKSPLRLWAESHPQAVALGCYAEEGANLRQAVIQAMEGVGLRHSPPVLDALASALSGDLMLLKQEVEKLRIYMGDDLNVTLDDVAACISGYAQEELDALLNAVILRQPAAIQTSLMVLEAQKQPAVQIIRSLLLFFLRLLAVRDALDGGMGADGALMKARPPFFFKQAPIIKQGLPRWPMVEIKQMISRLRTLERDSKLNGGQDFALIGQLLLVREEA